MASDNIRAMRAAPAIEAMTGYCGRKVKEIGVVNIGNPIFKKLNNCCTAKPIKSIDLLVIVVILLGNKLMSEGNVANFLVKCSVTGRSLSPGSRVGIVFMERENTPAEDSLHFCGSRNLGVIVYGEVDFCERINLVDEGDNLKVALSVMNRNLKHIEDCNWGDVYSKIKNKNELVENFHVFIKNVLFGWLKVDSSSTLVASVIDRVVFDTCFEDGFEASYFGGCDEPSRGISFKEYKADMRERVVSSMARGDEKAEMGSHYIHLMSQLVLGKDVCSICSDRDDFFDYWGEFENWQGLSILEAWDKFAERFESTMKLNFMRHCGVVFTPSHSAYQDYQDKIGSRYRSFWNFRLNQQLAVPDSHSWLV